MNNLERKKWIDAIKGITIFFVVLAHACGSLYNSNMGNNIYTKNINVFCNSFIMPLFFTISGFVFFMSYVNTDGVSYIDKRRFNIQVLNLTTTYVMFSTLRILIKIIFSSEVNNELSYSSLFKIPITAVQECWYIYVMILLYLVAPLFFRLKNNKYIIVFMLSSIIYSCFEVDTSITSILVLYYAFFFFYGVLLSRKNIKSNFFDVKFIFIQLVVAVICCYILILGYDIGIHKFLAGLFITNCFIYFFRKIECDKPIYNILAFIGRYSFEIYLLHFYVTSGGRPLIRFLGISNWVSMLVLLTTFGVLTPICISKILKKLRLWFPIFKPVTFIKNIKK